VLEAKVTELSRKKNKKRAPQRPFQTVEDEVTAGFYHFL
jgi:hypothetical protein